MINVRLPHGVRNISTKMTRSNSCMLSGNKDYIVAGVRYVLEKVTIIKIYINEK